MESEFLYRYISFETFVGMVQKRALTFVLPSTWEDPKEEMPFLQLVKKKETAVEKAFFIALCNKVYAQSWSEHAESDAMWRIYAFNSRALRIKVRRDKINLLKDVTAIHVKYSDEPFDCSSFEENQFLHSFAYKRTAFSHEKEVRLISHYKYHGEEDARQHIEAVYILFEHPSATKIFDSILPDMELEEKIDFIVNLLNIGTNCKKTKDISYAHIPDFIDGVMVHPLSPDWYVEIVRVFCERNNIPFEGKSELYS